jgi:glycosyltransferase involved in cell wall biosynthesis
MTSRRPAIGFVTAGDPNDRRSWSGIHYFMAQALQARCGDVRALGPASSAVVSIGKAADTVSRRLLGRSYDHSHSMLLARRYARIFRDRMAGQSFDFLFAPAASTEIAFLKSPVPIVYSSDTTFRLVHGYYPGFSNLLGLSVAEADRIERLAIRNAALLVYPSQWAAESAVRDYCADPAKVHVIPYGANLDEVPPAVEPRAEFGECRLLFVGVDWTRKGGDIALETLAGLASLSIPARLTICGSVPPADASAGKIEAIPFLDKNKPAERERLARLYRSAHFVLLPSRSECYGISLCEAAAFGVPVLAADTGGIPEIVQDGENGFLLPVGADGSRYARVIAGVWRDRQRYLELAAASRRQFESRLNWDAWASSLAKLVARL